MTMLTWKQKQINHTKKGSQTPGRTKGSNCQATMEDKYFASRSRSYKDPDYHAWCQRKQG